MKLESLKNGKFEVLEKNQLVFVNGGEDSHQVTGDGSPGRATLNGKDFTFYSDALVYEHGRMTWYWYDKDCVEIDKISW